MGIFDGMKETPEMKQAKANLANAEAELQDKIFQLGQMYYVEHKNDTNIEAKYQEMIELISRLDENRKGFFKNKLSLEGKMMCENCGAIIPLGMIYCNMCGKRASEKQNDLLTPSNSGLAGMISKCSRCGTELTPDSVFCTSCGWKVRE